MSSIDDVYELLSLLEGAQFEHDDERLDAVYERIKTMQRMRSERDVAEVLVDALLEMQALRSESATLRRYVARGVQPGTLLPPVEIDPAGDAG